MARADAEALRALLPVLRQLREIKGVKEATRPVTGNAARPSSVPRRGGAMRRVKKPGGAGFDDSRSRRRPISDKLVDRSQAARAQARRE